MVQWFRKSLKRKLSFLLLVSILLPLLSLGFFTYKIATMTTEEQAKQSGMSSLMQLESTLTFMIQDVENMSIFMIGQRDIQLFLNHDDDTPVSYTLIAGSLSNLVFSKPYISDITIFPIDGTPPLSNTTVLESDLTNALRQAYKYGHPGEMVWTTAYRQRTLSGVKWVISMYRPIRNYDTYEITGNLAISIDRDSVTDLLEQSRLGRGGFAVLLDNQNRVIAGGQPDWLLRPVDELLPGMVVMDGESGVANYGKAGNMQTVLYRTLQPMGWKIVGIIPYDEYQAQNRYVLLLTAVAVAVALLLIAVLVLFFLQRVTKPLVGLTHYLREANPDRPIPTYQITSPDEVGQLIRSYNRLTDRILNLTDQVKLGETMKKEADIRALEAQLNPHFLYNTLSSIHWMALKNKDEPIARMVGALSDFMRLSLNRGEEFCLVQQEVAHAKNYTDLQSIRFQGKFDIRFFVSPELLGRTMLKLLLQPLIENALMHGIWKKQGKGFIDIHIYPASGGVTNMMHIVVEDNGVGMSASRLYEVSSGLDAPSGENPPSPSASYGLRNVHERLQLHYGKQYGLSIFSQEGEGTRIEFYIPLPEEAEV